MTSGLHQRRQVLPRQFPQPRQRVQALEIRRELLQADAQCVAASCTPKAMASKRRRRGGASSRSTLDQTDARLTSDLCAAQARVKAGRTRLAHTRRESMSHRRPRLQQADESQELHGARRTAARWEIALPCAPFPGALGRLLCLLAFVRHAALSGHQARRSAPKTVAAVAPADAGQQHASSQPSSISAASHLTGKPGSAVAVAR